MNDLWIRLKAIQLLEEYYMKSKHPIRPRLLARKMGIVVQFIDNITIKKEAYCFYDDTKDHWYIVVNLAIHQTCERIRFNIAHEIAHVVYNHQEANNPDFERIADIFANELLMPTQFILDNGIDTVEAIMRKFLVSRTAAENKLKYMKYNAIYINS